jgi:carotenoid cleavage dioxygenase-like enzyme
VSELTSKTTETTTNKIDRTTPPRSPKAVLSTSREEFYGQDSEHQPLELIVKEGMTENTGQLPEDLQGHVFIVGPVGTIDSPHVQDSPYVVEPAKDGWTPLFNGDGMIYRLDFHQTPQIATDGAFQSEAGKAWMSTRIVKTPDYYADTALKTNPLYPEKWPKQYPFLKFNNFGLSRLSLEIGARNSLNTAFLPMKFSDDTERLLVTWDAGRPYEIDPRTLGLVAPIGWAEQWKPITQALNLLRMPFPPTLSAAHPVFDTHTDEMFTVNAGKSLQTLIWLSRLLPFEAKECADRYLHNRLLKKIFEFCVRLWANFVQFIVFFLEWFFEDVLGISGICGKNFVYLNRWTGSETAVDRWEVLDEKGRPLKIQQSLHQMALTQDYVILSDSAFKLALADLLPYFDSKQSGETEKNLLKSTQTPEEIDRTLEQRKFNLLKFLREYLSYPELDYTDLYIIPRHQLQAGVPSVTAKKITIEPETAHFLAEYENPNGKITLYVAHNSASDPAEFIHKVDESFYDDPEITQALQERSGVIASPMDVNQLGYWAIDVEKGTTERVLLPNSEAQKYLWSLAIYAWQGFQPDRFSDIYWNCWGAWQELVSKFIVEMYDDYKKRTVPLSEMLDEVLKNSQPANLIRLHIDRSSNTLPQLSVPDAYEFPDGHFGNSPQFIPRSGTEDPTDGYITCVVIYSDNLLANKSELWIFDAKNLNAGPCYRLSHPQLNIGVTVHSTWLSKLETPPARTDYDVRKDYENLIQNTHSEAIETLFEEDVYPHFQ